MLQQYAHVQIPDLIPKGYKVGEAENASGQVVQYQVTQFIEHAENLESLWPALTIAQKAKIADQVVEAMEAFQKQGVSKIAQRVRVHDASISGGTGTPLIGGPKHGFSTTMHGFLTQFVANHQSQKNSTSFITETPEGTLVKSAQTL